MVQISVWVHGGVRAVKECKDESGMTNKLSPKEKSIRDQGGLESQEPASLVLRAPVDMYSFSLALLAVLAVIFVLHWARAIFIPLMLGVMISYALSPPVNLMQKWRIPRAIGAALLLPAIVGGTGSLVYSLSDDAAKLIETLPDAAQKIRLSRLKERGTSEGTMENVQKNRHPTRTCSERDRRSGTCRPSRGDTGADRKAQN